MEELVRVKALSRSSRRVLELVVTLMIAVVSSAILLGNMPSAQAASTAENRVRAISASAEPLAGLSEHITAGQQLGNDAADPEFVVVTGVAANTVRYGPVNPGPLDGAIANTFRSGSYTGVTASKPTSLYRVYSGNKELGSYWTRTKPSGPVQSIVDSALDPAWGNQATRWVKARVPAGTTFYEGAAAPQGGLVGGGNQVFIPRVDPSWVVGRGGF